MKVTSKLKRKSEYSQGSLREIFDDEVNQSEVGGFISFAQLESTMYKRKRLCTPEVPLNARTAMSLMEDPGEEFKMYHAFSIEELDEVAIAFMSSKWKNDLHPADQTELQADATFYVVPKQFSSIVEYILAVQVSLVACDSYFDGKKTGTLYDKVVAKVIEILPFIASIIKTDFESSMYSSFAKGFPMQGSAAAYFTMIERYTKLGFSKKTIRFPYRETYHKRSRELSCKFEKKYKSHNPNYWDFIKNLNKVIQTTEKDIEIIDNHVPIRRKKRPVTIQKEKYIDALQQQLINGDITPNNYLKTITHQYKTQFARFKGFIESVENVDTENKEEDLIQDMSTEQNSNTCRICLVNVPDTLIMPCRHAQTCFSCTERIVNSDNNNCPICREPIENFINIFL
ncbi:hypothetical protein LOD99_1442 [Oopsacas minuta]|uniref:RING-type domain-containing protein n=1 Tax=Oopsacas minuta TaxID=111878 RepID=A0AAV7K5S6_9METZ|nr:hypothetical protein LOD99_1442 [Oopsacas minuta]